MALFALYAIVGLLQTCGWWIFKVLGRNGILRGMSQTAFFNEHPLPVFEFLSSDSKRQLELYLLNGNTAFKQKRLLEFFKTLDWLGPDEMTDARLLQKLQPTLQRRLQREIREYHAQKALNRSMSSEKREEYRLRVFEYFRIKMPSSDKALLESLRDFELDLTGRDVNWRHYFTLDSFKKIDAFIQASHAERQALFARFKKDVETYQKNYEKIHQAQYARACDQPFTFDDWCDMMGDEAPRTASNGKQNNKRYATASPQNAVYQACQILEVSASASRDEVKKQFRKLTLQHHPDLPNGSEEKMKAIVGAYQEIQRYWSTLL